ncbi:branched-chain amino acid aminotransferase [Candidatus Carsonella ruddii CS isolate Thao2000]|uniref:Branched-chain amino acid aminotransferase n=1 Tax=Candidatus Carsonella ruddii CS isolate Thao2000 TaxID=1202537 RepID=J7H0K0_CARRU|nr:aminotransferase class IV [Candidatus Carsonella ruddii]AFP83845.1 branched-chain amino acid aminotransferase [Candidatus Carsonella ruddii CS isolate Thao2000]
MKLGFYYKKIKYRFFSIWNNNWINGFFIKKNKININEGSTCINYSQQCFEGLKCFFYKKKKNFLKIEKNSFRLQKSCKKLLIPIISVFFLINCILINSFLNKNYIPNKKKGFLYIRPLVLGIGNNIGVKTSKNFLLIIYNSIFLFEKKKKFIFKSNFNKRIINNLGNYKLGANYIINLYDNFFLKIYNYKDFIYINNNFFDEIGTANIIFYKKKKIVFYKKKSILPGNNNFYINILLKKINFFFIKDNINFKKITNLSKIFFSGTAANFFSVDNILFKNKIISYKKKYIYFFLKKILKI